MAKKKIEENNNITKQEQTDILAQDVLSIINKSFKEFPDAAGFLKDANMVVDWISTGDDILDLAISNRPNGGLPTSKIVELSGLEGCVTEDTEIEVEVIIGQLKNKFHKKIKIGEVENLIKSGKKVYVKTIGNEFTQITDYIHKGNLQTYLVNLENGLNIKVSSEHKFFTNSGWVMLKDLRPDLHKILCEDEKYYSIETIENIGQHKIVDITVEHPEHCYFGNGMLNHNSGKSLMAAHIMAECQKKGGLAVLFDTEGAVGMLDFYRSIGLDIEKLIYIDKLRALEDIYKTINNIVVKHTTLKTNKPLVIVVDSVMGASTNKELEEDVEKKGYATEKALINSNAMRIMPSLLNGRNILLVLINQLRANMNAFGPASDPWQTTGGTAIPFTASVRLRFKKMGQIKGKINGMENAIGERIQVQIVKNRVGPPRRKVTFDVRYDSGIDKYGSWLNCLKDLGAISQSGTSYTYQYIDMETGEEITKKFQSKNFKRLLEENSTLKEVIYNQICDEYIMKYAISDEDEELGIDDVELETNNEE